MKHKYRMCFDVETLKDAAAFEDLANSLGVKMELVSVEQDTAPPSREFGGRKYRMTPTALAHIKNTIKQHPNADNTSIRKLSGVKQSPATIGRARRGEFDKGGVRHHSMMPDV